MDLEEMIKEIEEQIEENGEHEEPFGRLSDLSTKRTPMEGRGETCIYDVWKEKRRSPQLKKSENLNKKGGKTTGGKGDSPEN